MASTYARTNSQLLRELGRSITKSIVKGFAGFQGAVTTAILISDAIERGFETLSTYQSRALAVNQTITEFLNQNMKVLQDLPGGMMSAADEALTAKMEGIPLTKGYLRLAQQLKYSGQTNEGLLATMVLLRSSTTLTEESLSELSENIVKYGVKGQVSQDKLLKAIGGLDKSMVLFDMAGISKPIADAAAALTAKGGADLAPRISEFIGQLLGQGFDSLRETSIYGVNQQIAEIDKGIKVSENLLSIAHVVAKRFKDTFDPNDNMSAQMLGGFLRVMPEFTQNAYMLSNRFKDVGGNLEQEFENIRRNEELLNKITHSYEAFKDTFISPLTIMLLDIGSKLMDFAVKHGTAVKAFAYAVAGYTLGKGIGYILHAGFIHTKILGIQLMSFLRKVSQGISMLLAPASFIGPRVGMMAVGKLILGGLLRFAGPLGIIASLALLIYQFMQKEEPNKELEDIAKNTKEQADKIRSDRFKNSMQTIPSYAKETNENISEALMSIIRFSELRLQASNKLTERMANATEKTAKGIEILNQNRGFKNPIPGMGLSR